jgi:hypothetical protein
MQHRGFSTSFLAALLAWLSCVLQNVSLLFGLGLPDVSCFFYFLLKGRICTGLLLY